MIRDNQPKVPNLPPLIANGDSNRGYYVCTYQNKWDRTKKRSVRVSSTSVGRVQGKEKFGLIEFYDEFVKQYPGLKRFKVYRTEGAQRLVFIPKQPRRTKRKDIEDLGINQSAVAARAARAESIMASFDDADLDL